MLKMSEWQTGAGHWYVADTQDLANDSGAWWYPARQLKIPLTEYLKLVVSYKPDHLYYNKDTGYLSFYWYSNNYAMAHKFLLYINKLGRNVK